MFSPGSGEAACCVAGLCTCVYSYTWLCVYTCLRTWKDVVLRGASAGQKVLILLALCPVKRGSNAFIELYQT